MQSAKFNITCSAMLCYRSDFNLLKLGYPSVTLGYSSLCSHTGFNQSKPIFFPSNTAATAHKKNCSMSSNSVNSLLRKLSTNSLNTSQVGSHFLVNSPICGTTRQGSNLVYYVWWLQSTVPIASSAASKAQGTPPILGSITNPPIGRRVFLHRQNIHC